MSLDVLLTGLGMVALLGAAYAIGAWSAVLWDGLAYGECAFDPDGGDYLWLRCEACPYAPTPHEDHGDGRATCMWCGSVRHVAKEAGR